MKTAGWITFFYGLFIFVGGLIGYLKAESIISLIMGILFGVLLIICSIGMLKDRLFPAYMGILLTLILDAFFTYRFMMTYTFMPSGLMCVVSLVVLVIIALLIRTHLNKQRKN